MRLRKIMWPFVRRYVDANAHSAWATTDGLKILKNTGPSFS